MTQQTFYPAEMLRELTHDLIQAEKNPEGEWNLFLDIALTVGEKKTPLALTVKEISKFPETPAGMEKLAGECLAIAQEIRGQKVEVIGL